MEDPIRRQREYFDRGATRSREARDGALARLAGGLQAHETQLLEALREDLGKDPVEAWLSEVGFLLGEIKHARRRLKRWTKPSRRSVPAMAWPGRARVCREPHGVCLVLAPWNYPLQLALGPAVGALAAGNTAVVKASELAPATAEAMRSMVAKHLDPGELTVVTGGAEQAEALLGQAFDHIFFTGGTAIGRKVMARAAERLTPVTLELGGKCPAIVSGGRSIETIARRLVWGKFMNAGQTCVAPDHVWVDREHHDELVASIVRTVREFYPEGVGKIVNRRHFDRLVALLGEGEQRCGGESDPERLRIAPTVLSGVGTDAACMRDEIFGPILPVLAYDRLDEPLEWLRGQGDPLAVYLFTEDRTTRERIERETRSGGLCVNDTIVQITGPDLPFGGVGESGMGRYHGKAGFDCFSWERVVLRRGLWPDFAFRYPPPKMPLEKLKRYFGG